MQYSPKLKKAMKQIKKVLKDNDIAGVVVLHTPGYSEYLLRIDPTYSCAKLMPDGSGIRMKTKGLAIPQKRKKKLAEDTTNMLSLLASTTGETALSLIEVSKVVDKMLSADHTDRGHTSDYELNN